MEQKTKPLHSGHRERVKAKALQGGIECWPSHEVLELILMYAIPQKDVNPLAHELLNTFGSLSGVLDAGLDQLKMVKGIGDNAATFLTLLPEFFDKYNASKNVDAVILDNATKCVNHFRSTERIRHMEECYIYCLNAKKKLVKTVRYNNGFSSFISINMKDIAKEILLHSCRSILFIHTHPNGSPFPTFQDCEATKILIQRITALGLKFEDHLIITEDSFYSYLQEKLIDDYKRELGILTEK